MNYAPIIKEIGRGAKSARALSETDAFALFADMLDGRLPALELGAVLLALRIKGEELAELAGFLAALDTRTARLEAPAGPRCVLLPSYNGARRQANLMPLVAMLLARDGIPVLVHGFHDFPERLDPFALFGELGIAPASSLDEASSSLAETRLALVGLDTLSPGLTRLLALRARLGVRNVGHTLAKLIDPCPGRSVRVVPMTHPEAIAKMTELLARLKAQALLMRGSEGEAYALPRRRPRLLGFFAGEELELFPAEEGDASRTVRAAESNPVNAALIRAQLAGEETIPQPILDQVAALSRLAHS